MLVKCRCAQFLLVPEAASGHRGRCGSCGAEFLVPAAPAAAPAPKPAPRPPTSRVPTSAAPVGASPEASPFFFQCWASFLYALPGLPVVAFALLGLIALVAAAVVGLSILTAILGPLFGLIATVVLIVLLVGVVGYFGSIFFSIIYHSARGSDSFPLERTTPALQAGATFVAWAFLWWGLPLALAFAAAERGNAALAAAAGLLALAWGFPSVMAIVGHAGARLSNGFNPIRAWKGVAAAPGPYAYLWLMILLTTGLAGLATSALWYWLMRGEPSKVAQLVYSFVSTALQVYFNMAAARCAGLFARHYRARLPYGF